MEATFRAPRRKSCGPINRVVEPTAPARSRRGWPEAEAQLRPCRALVVYLDPEETYSLEETRA
jgi:hypothetical protein